METMKNLLKFSANWVGSHVVEIVVIVSITGLLLMTLTGCVSRRTVSSRTVHDTCYITRKDSAYIKQLMKDSTYRWDSVSIRELIREDTVYLWRVETHYQWRDRIRVDTVIKTRMDSVYLSNVDTTLVTKTLKAELNRWQCFRLRLGDVMLLVLVCCLIYGAVRVYLRYFSAR